MKSVLDTLKRENQNEYGKKDGAKKKQQQEQKKLDEQDFIQKV
jgi:hypothetical protein